MIRKIGYALVAVFLFIAVHASAQDDTTRVLFIGNSHTYMNNVPSLVANLSLSGGHPMVTGMSAPGGYTLQQHTTNPITLEMISRGTWDIVVLQEQSIYPVIDYYRFNSFYPAARHLDSLITALGQHTALYMTWGRPRGGLWSIGGHYTIDFADFFQMQDSISASFRMIADELDAILVPAGDAWAVARNWDSTISLWQNDSLHATLQGSYLAACVFYAIFFNSSPIGLSYTAGLTEEEALFLQRAADQTTSDIVDDPQHQPELISLLSNHPNPFNSSTSVVFELPRDGHANLAIYNMLGERVRILADNDFVAGRHQVTWDGTDDGGSPVASGIYFTLLSQGRISKSLKLLLMK